MKTPGSQGSAEEKELPGGVMSLMGLGGLLQPLFIILEKSTFPLNQEPSPSVVLGPARLEPGPVQGMKRVMDLNCTSLKVFLADLSVTTALSPVFLPVRPQAHSHASGGQRGLTLEGGYVLVSMAI